MERLTTWRKDGKAAIANNDGSNPMEQMYKVTGIIDRLAAIEDILGDNYDLDRLRELTQADREGRCVVLPCKAGDTFYRGDEKYKADHWNVVLTAIFWAGERKNITLLYPEEVGKVLEEMEDK